MSSHAKDMDLPTTTTTNMVKIPNSSKAHQDSEIPSSGRKRKFGEFEEPEDESSPSGKKFKGGEDTVDSSVSKTKDIHSGIDLSTTTTTKQTTQSSTNPVPEEDYETEGTLNHEEEEEPTPSSNPKIEDNNNNDEQNPETITKIHQTLKESKEEPTPKEIETQDEDDDNNNDWIKRMIEKERLDPRPWDERLYRNARDPPSDSPTLTLGKDLLGGNQYIDIVTGDSLTVAISTPGRILDDKEKELWEQYAREMEEAALMPLPDEDDDEDDDDDM